VAAAEFLRPGVELKHKIFFTLNPPPDPAAEIVRLTDTLSAEGYLTGRRTPPDLFHLSLNNLGAYAAVPRDLIDFACEVASTIRAPSFVLALNCVMSFGGGSVERPLVLGGDDGVIGADMLYERIYAALVARGLRVRQTAFTPHLTLSWKDAPRPKRFIDPIAWRVSELRLVDGVHGERRHDILGCWSLAG
jgi:RNA 2',3'-cyclic 3'-phosphodiesterase